MTRKIVLLLQISLVSAGLLSCLAAWKFDAILKQPLNLTQVKLLNVSVGATPTGTFNHLKNDGLLDSPFWLSLYWRLNLANQPLQCGEYRMIPGMTAKGLISLWQRGEVVQYSLTLVEGWNFNRVRLALVKHEKIVQTLSGLSNSDVMEKLGHPGVFPEGRFFPDTYRFVRGMTDVEFLKKAYNRLDYILAQEWSKRAADASYADSYQALIMATLIEKETSVPEERGQIAGVFMRRMKIGMLLQADPTVIYGLGERYTGRLTRVHLKEANPYNTYMVAGLPPTPIAMAGRKSIHAALNYVPSNHLYFVARGDGSHIFSDDLNSHNAAVREFQLKRCTYYRSSPAPTVKSMQDTILSADSAPAKQSTNFVPNTATP
ncbi:endolytic transglycosylase MltG [Candidatus Pseudomonas adelgestsugas]|uniref:endolytic transglycosylase MltG n=1 Tax=Candidatus Pseudomonas adelgestsugas TaxID=1302376 RepID=UPI00100F1D12|nr:endolytic transglycosylase MltG [Candidatus Pseudomonas adelgestsugas]